MDKTKEIIEFIKFIRKWRLNNMLKYKEKTKKVNELFRIKKSAFCIRIKEFIIMEKCYHNVMLNKF